LTETCATGNEAPPNTHLNKQYGIRNHVSEGDNAEEQTTAISEAVKGPEAVHETRKAEATIWQAKAVRNTFLACLSACIFSTGGQKLRGGE